MIVPCVKPHLVKFEELARHRNMEVGFLGKACGNFARQEVGFLGMSIWSETSRLVSKSLFLNKGPWKPEFTKLAVLVRHKVMVKPGEESLLVS